MLVNCPHVNRVLDAYGDGEFGRVEAREVRDRLDVCLSCRQRAAARESLGRLIRRVRYYAAPDRLRVDVARTRRPDRVSPWVLAWAAMVTLAASLGSGTVIRAIRAQQTAAATTAIAQDVVASHVRASMDAHLLDGRQARERAFHTREYFGGHSEIEMVSVNCSSMGDIRDDARRAPERHTYSRAGDT